MWFFWLFALLPIAVGVVLWLRDSKAIVWQEWLIGSGVALLTAGMFTVIAHLGRTSDIEMWSGVIERVEHRPEWVEEYEESHTRQVPGTDSDGNTIYTTETYYTTEHDTHPEHWRAYLNFGNGADNEGGFFDSNWGRIDVGFYNEIKNNFGGKVTISGKQPTEHIGGDYDGGDNNIYATYNETGYMYPVNKTKHFENRIKAAPSLFSFSEVPETVKVYDWPSREWAQSDRLLGTAAVLINRYQFDCLNSRLGPVKKVNVIMVGFGNQGSDMGHYQEAKWIGGKKNDLVITFGGGTKDKPATWAYVFGWTEKGLVKENLQTLLLNNPINDNLLPLIEKEIRANYTIKDWSKFDYITIEPPTWSYWTYAIVLLISQTILWIVFHNNRMDAEQIPLSPVLPIKS